MAKLSLTRTCWCSEDEIKQELNARGYDDVLGMDVDIALEALFTEMSAEMFEQARRVRLCSQPQQISSVSCMQGRHHQHCILGYLP